MNILAADDNKYALETLIREIEDIIPGNTINSFTLPSKALDFINNECRELKLAFLDVEMPGMSGIELAAWIKKKFPRVVIIFVSAYPQYTLDAFKVHAAGYLVKPISKEMLETELSELSQPFIYKTLGRIRAHTFGNFELYVDEKPVRFARSKSKELIAFLIDRRGASCTMNELAAVLFDESGNEKAQQRYIRNLIADIKASLSDIKAESIICKGRNSISIDISQIDCDYYRMLEGEPAAVNMFLGEYMTNYSWAEFTVGELKHITDR
ncbi:MAG: response regulator [Oscillospiraceae bacterium]|nr:response regulator [Oscillospiraceae bacterium]